MRLVVPGIVRRKMRRDLVGQGLGRHTRDEIAARGCADLDALAAALGKDGFFGGDEPSVLDATMYAFLANQLWTPGDSPLKQHLTGRRPTLVGYCERMERRIGR